MLTTITILALAILAVGLGLATAYFRWLYRTEARYSEHADEHARKVVDLATQPQGKYYIQERGNAVYVLQERYNGHTYMAVVVRTFLKDNDPQYAYMLAEELKDLLNAPQ